MTATRELSEALAQEIARIIDPVSFSCTPALYGLAPDDTESFKRTFAHMGQLVALRRANEILGLFEAHLIIDPAEQSKMLTFAHMLGVKRARDDETFRHIAFITAIREAAGIGAGTAIADIPAAVADLRASERAAGREEAAKLAEAEPEMPGDPPAHILQAMIAVGPIENARSACRATKKSIAASIRAIGEKP